MCTADLTHAAGDAFGPAGCGFLSTSQALAMAGAALDYLNSAAVVGPDGAACGETLITLGEIQAKLTAAHAAFLRRFDAAGAHDADGYGSTSAWLAGQTTRLRFGTGLLVLPMRRDIVVTAKQIATLDQLSGGRVEIGIGVGAYREEFEAVQPNVKAHRGDMARDLDGDPVFLAQHEFSLNYEAERWKAIRFAALKDYQVMDVAA